VIWFVGCGILIAAVCATGRAQQNDAPALGPQDVLTITVWGQPEISGKFTVDADGNLTFPLVGRVKVAGLLPHDVEEALKQRLSDGYLKNPQLSVSEERSETQTINVVGEVKQAGSFPAARGMSLIEALARAGSTTDMAAGTILVTRLRTVQAPSGTTPPADEETAEVIRVNLEALQSGAATNLQLRGGETVFVPRADLVYVLGAVRNPGTYPIREQTTVLQAVALAGGLTDRGSLKSIRIVRHSERGGKPVKVKVDALLRPGDTLMVGERIF
jgi:polysaccharide export outer membrane protein